MENTRLVRRDMFAPTVLGDNCQKKASSKNRFEDNDQGWNQQRGSETLWMFRLTLRGTGWCFTHPRRACVSWPKQELSKHEWMRIL